jgi:tetratricopeptide (TPR) repeat protein
MTRRGLPVEADEDPFVKSFRERLRATPPDILPGTDGMPDRAPELAGLADLVPVRRGGAGLVYRATDVASGRTVAVKVLLVGQTHSPSARARILQEASILAALDHPRLVRVLDAGEIRDTPGWPDGVPYLVMEWIEGKPLDQCIGVEALTVTEAARVVRDLAGALTVVHAEGIVHRDLKPANVILATGPDIRPAAKLIDFGLARIDEAGGGLTTAGEILGTPGYMAPEQAAVDEHLGEVGPATDVHGLGGILFFLLFGRPPFAGRTAVEAFASVVKGKIVWPTAAMRQLPRPLRTILETCLERRPARRYPSAAALESDLGRFLEGRSIVARRPTVPARIGGWCRRRPVVAVSLLLWVAFILTGICGLAIHGLQMRQAREAAIASQQAAQASLEQLPDGAMERIISRSPPLDENSVEYLRGLMKLYSDTPLGPDTRNGARFRITRLRGLAAIFARTERIDDAIECLDLAMRQCDDLHHVAARGGALSSERIEIIEEKLRVLRAANRLEAAEAVVRGMLRWVDDAAIPLSSRSADLVATARLGLGYVINEQGRTEEALPVITAALAELRHLSEDDPDDLEILRNELDGYYYASAVSATAGRSEDRCNLLRTMTRRAEEAIERFPAEAAGFEEKLVLGLASLADAEAAAGRFGESLAVVGRLREEVDDGLRTYPDRPFFRHESIEAAIRESIATRGLDAPDRSLALLEEALVNARREVAMEPAVYVHAQRLVKVLQNLGLLHEAAGRPTLAIDAFREMIAPLEPWAEAPDRKSPIRSIWSGAHARIGSLLHRQGDMSGAVASHEQALIDAEPAQRPPILVALASAALESGNTALARRAAEEALLDPATSTPAHQILSRIPD